MPIRRAIDNAIVELRTVRWLTRILWRPMLGQLRSERRRRVRS
jgi:hypothetical protein